MACFKAGEFGSATRSGPLSRLARRRRGNDAINGRPHETPGATAPGRAGRAVSHGARPLGPRRRGDDDDRRYAADDDPPRYAGRAASDQVERHPSGVSEQRPQRRLRDQLLLQRDELRVQRQRDRRPRRREPARHLEPERVARVGDGGRPVARRHHVHHRRNGHHHADRLLRERRQLRHVQVEFREHRQLQQRQAPPRRRRAATGTGQRLRRTQRRVQRSQHFLAAGRSELLLRVHPGYRADGVSRGPLLDGLDRDAVRHARQHRQHRVARRLDGHAVDVQPHDGRLHVDPPEARLRRLRMQRVERAAAVPRPHDRDRRRGVAEPGDDRNDDRSQRARRRRRRGGEPHLHLGGHGGPPGQHVQRQRDQRRQEQHRHVQPGRHLYLPGDGDGPGRILDHRPGDRRRPAGGGQRDRCPRLADARSARNAGLRGHAVRPVR